MLGYLQDIFILLFEVFLLARVFCFYKLRVRKLFEIIFTKKLFNGRKKILIDIFKGELKPGRPVQGVTYFFNFTFDSSFGNNFYTAKIIIPVFISLAVIFI